MELNTTITSISKPKKDCLSTWQLRLNKLVKAKNEKCLYRVKVLFTFLEAECFDIRCAPKEAKRPIAPISRSAQPPLSHSQICYSHILQRLQCRQKTTDCLPEIPHGLLWLI